MGVFVFLRNKFIAKLYNMKFGNKLFLDRIIVEGLFRLKNKKTITYYFSLNFRFLLSIIHFLLLSNSQISPQLGLAPKLVLFSTPKTQKIGTHTLTYATSAPEPLPAPLHSTYPKTQLYHTKVLHFPSQPQHHCPYYSSFQLVCGNAIIEIRG